MRCYLARHNIIFLLQVVVFLILLNSYGQHFSSAEYPIFRESDPKSKVIGVLNTSRNFQILETRKNYILQNPASTARSSGLKYYRDCILVSQNNKTGWVIDGITVRNKTLFVDFKIDRKLLPALFSSLALSLILLGLLILKYTKFKKWEKFISDPSNIFLLILFLLIIRISLIFNVLFHAGTFFVGTDDVAGYFQTGQSIFLTRDFTLCKYLVGHSFFVGLFSLIFGLKTWQEMVLPFSYFSTVIIGSLTGIFIYTIAKLRFRSKTAALTSLLIYVIYPFIIQVNHTRGIFSRDFIGFPSVHEYSLRLYYWTALVGFNALSDMSNMCFILGLFTLALYLYPMQNDENRKDYIYNYPLLLGVLFGFSGSIRPSNIYFLPFIMYIVLQNTINWKEIKYWHALNKLCFLAIGTIIGFAPQILANYLQDGNIFTLPYHLFHSKALQKGFELSFLSTGGGMIFNGSSMLFSFAIAGIFLVKRELRIFASFWIIPLLLFYCGYFGVSSVVRFILPIFPILMILSQQTLRKCSITSIIVLGILFLFKSKYFISEQQEMTYITILIAWTVAGGLAYVVSKRKFPKKTNLHQAFLIFGVLLFSQTMFIISSLSYGRYAFIVFFAALILSCFFKDQSHSLKRG